MSDAQQTVYRVACLSAVKHDYVPKGVLSHARFVPVVVADDADQPEWVHDRNEQLASELGVPYVRDVERALRDFRVQVAVVSSEAERHVALSLRAAEMGIHVVQDKPMSTRLDACDALVESVERNDVRFLMWNRNYLPAVIHGREVIASGHLGPLRAIHIDFYFAKDAGPPIGRREAGAPQLDWLEHLKSAHATGADGGVGHRAMGELEVEGIYPLAYIYHMIDRPARSVFARATAHFHQLHADHGVDDLSSLTLQYDGGIIATICMGRIGNASHPDIGEMKLHLHGATRSMVISEARPEVRRYYRDQPDSEFPSERIANRNDWFLADDFARAIDDNRATCLDARPARDICATVQAAIRSGQSGRVEPIE